MVWHCNKCGYETKYSGNFKRHLLRDSCNKVRNDETMLAKMRKDYDAMWIEVRELNDSIEKVYNIDELITLHDRLKYLFIQIKKYAPKLDEKYNEEELNDILEEIKKI